MGINRQALPKRTVLISETSQRSRAKERVRFSRVFFPFKQEKELVRELLPVEIKPLSCTARLSGKIVCIGGGIKTQAADDTALIGSHGPCVVGFLV